MLDYLRYTPIKRQMYAIIWVSHAALRLNTALMSTKIGLEMSRKIFTNDIWLPIRWSFSNANAQKSEEALYTAGANWSVFHTQMKLHSFHIWGLFNRWILCIHYIEGETDQNRKLWNKRLLYR